MSFVHRKYLGKHDYNSVAMVEEHMNKVVVVEEVEDQVVDLEEQLVLQSLMLQMGQMKRHS
jgi:hypothetical protein